MAFSQTSVIILTFVVIWMLVAVMKKYKHLEHDVVTYSIGSLEFEEREIDDERPTSKLLHISQVVKKANDGGELTVVNVEFPSNGQDFIVELVKVVNYNSQISNEEVKADKEDDKFWVLISEGSIGTNVVTVEISSYVDINCDIEFYGYKEGEDEEL